ncbi:putative RNA-binding Zn-ribbon protein involved in translation (DUF1610 family) [Methylohalomonas lacus]|uniref:RNA-binding Zn-ribbon protein involved in translation (DUF1610 family) n=1 Tax=Methylohalomonas lacus TaxID=398773 RepID=A0AAE3HGQ8_9GAMM|nr:dimethylamine monooxygenase subunit DmmA family protein [Methylohalomonas lacus]MCS3902025.1 putative RNA-binding Zn-ribbon protein involved in translation (DUF1610 family) [Methylohalomonas lacus]
MIEGIKSRPVYSDLRPDLDGSHHLLVAEGAGAEALVRFCHAWDAAGDPDADYDILYHPDEDRRWIGTVNELAREAVAVFVNRVGLESVLARRLAAARMGLRLYVAGSEGFIWRVVAIAREAGLSEDAIQKERCGTQARPVSCVHCKTIADDVTTNVYQCPGCGLHVFVRDHFSRLLGAYQSVCVDAENPGELPEIEEVYA